MICLAMHLEYKLHGLSNTYPTHSVVAMLAELRSDSLPGADAYYRLVSRLLVPSHRQISLFGVIDNWNRVSIAAVPAPRSHGSYRGPLDILQFRDPLSDIVPFRIKPLALAKG